MANVSNTRGLAKLVLALSAFLGPVLGVDAPRQPAAECCPCSGTETLVAPSAAGIPIDAEMASNDQSPLQAEVVALPLDLRPFSTVSGRLGAAEGPMTRLLELDRTRPPARDARG